MRNFELALRKTKTSQLAKEEQIFIGDKLETYKPIKSVKDTKVRNLDISCGSLHHITNEEPTKIREPTGNGTSTADNFEECNRDMLSKIIMTNLNLADFNCQKCLEDFETNNYKMKLFCIECKRFRNLLNFKASIF